MFTREYTVQGQVSRFTIHRDTAGWHVTEERDNLVVKQMRYSDWHRVERALHLFDWRNGQAFQPLPSI